MTPIQHPLCNDILLRPADMTADQCGDLHILRQLPDHPSGGTVASFWKPGANDLANLNHGGHSTTNNAIFFANLIFGWTIIGWFIVLIWAIAERETAKPTPPSPQTTL